MTFLEEYRRLSGWICEARAQSRLPGNAAEREAARCEAVRLEALRERVLGTLRENLDLHVSNHLPRTGTLEAQLLALAPAARAAYRAKLRWEAAQEDFAVHLLTWADSVEQEQMAPKQEQMAPKQEQAAPKEEEVTPATH